MLVTSIMGSTNPEVADLPWPSNTGKLKNMPEHGGI